MSTESRSLETDPQVARLMDYEELSPAEEQRDDPNATRYGWSPGQDLDVSDRRVGTWAQPDELDEQGRIIFRPIIRRCSLIAFRTIPILTESRNRQETSESQYDQILGIPPRRLSWGEKSARACAEEVRVAYSQDTPVGFTVFDAPWVAKDTRGGQHVLGSGKGFVGMDRDEAFELYRIILPFVLKPKEILIYLLNESEERIKGADLPPEVEAASLAVRRQMIDGVSQCTDEAMKIIEASKRELGERPGTGKGKPVFDRYDRYLADMYGESLVAAPAVMQQSAPASDPALASALTMIAERLGPQPGESEEVRLLREQNELLKAQLEAQAPRKGKASAAPPEGS